MNGTADSPEPPRWVYLPAVAAAAAASFQRPDLSRFLPGLPLPRVTLGDLALGVAFAALAAWIILRKDWRRLLAVPAGVAAYLAVMAASGAACGHTKLAAKEMLQAVEMFACGWLVFYWGLSGWRARSLAIAAVIGVTAALVLGAVVQLFTAGGHHLVRAAFDNDNALGAHLAVTLPLIAALAAGEERPWFAAALYATSALGLLVVLPGGMLLAACAGICAACAMRGGRALAVAVAACAVLVLAVSPAIGRFQSRRLDSVAVFAKGVGTGGEPVVTARFKRWGAAVNLVRTSPVLGRGPGRCTEALEDHYGPGVAAKPAGNTKEPELWNIDSDEPGTFSMYEVTACETGLAGLAALLWIFAAAGGSAARALGASSGRERALLSGAFGAILGALVAGVFGSPLVSGTWTVLVMFMAMAARAADDSTRSTEGAAAPVSAAEDGPTRR